MAITSCDAKQCYDRVLLLMQCLVWMALTKDVTVVFVILVVLQNMRYFKRTGYGDSMWTFGGRHTALRWHGLGQGSRGAPFGWIHTSSPKINLLRKDGLFGTFANPITGEKTESVGSAFVDDVNMYTTGSPGDSIADILPDIDTHVYAWSKLL